MQISEQAKKTKKAIAETSKKAAKAYFSDTPKWAKIVRLIGLVIGAAGGAILATNPATLPVVLVTAAPYMTMLGNFTAMLVQGFEKK